MATSAMRVLRRCILACAIALSLLPIILLLIWSFLPQKEVLSLDSFNAIIKGGFTLKNYVAAWTETGFFKRLIASLSMSTGSMLAVVALGVPAAYAAARLQRAKAERVGFQFLSIRALPPIAVSITIYYLFNRSSLAPNWLSLGFLHIAITTPVFIWIMIPVFKSVPSELDELLLIDGFSRLKLLTLVLLPLIFQRMLAVFLICFVNVWNETFLSAVFQVNTVTEAIPTLISHHGYQWGTIMAIGAMVTVPTLAIIPLIIRLADVPWIRKN